jgi:hypothetical protein
MKNQESPLLDIQCYTQCCFPPLRYAYNLCKENEIYNSIDINIEYLFNNQMVMIWRNLLLNRPSWNNCNTMIESNL